MPDRKLLPSVQALRGIAASLVVYHHFADIFQDGEPSPSWIYRSGLGNFGNCGVDLFFVISGFIMVYTTVGKCGARDAGKFLGRRILRIYPIYWLWTSALLSLWLAGIAKLAGANHGKHYSALYIVKSYMLIPSFNGLDFTPFLAPGWSLSFEMLFYLLFYFSILLGVRRRKLPFLAAAFCALAILGMLAPRGGALAYLLPNALMIEFLYGVIAAELLLHANRYQLRLGSGSATALMSAGAAALLCPASLLLNPNWSLRFLFYGIPALCIVSGAAMLRHASAPRLLVYLGDCSYSIYLTHLFFALAVASALTRSKSLSGIQPDLLIMLAGTLAIGLSSLTYVFVEKPLNSWVNSVPWLPRKVALHPEPDGLLEN